ncbi:MAG: molybdopterin molybdotransferase MoeA [Lachnospirales bacterium]
MIYIPLDDGVDLIKKETSLNKIESWEELNLIDAHNRVLFEDVYSKIDNPPFNRSPIDGYACKSSDLENTTEENFAKLEVVGSIYAGSKHLVEVENGQAVRIMTGAPIPASCDCCVMQEFTNYGEDFVEVYKSHSPYKNFCFQGEDYKKDTLLVKKNSKLTYSEIGVLATSGVSKVKVYKMPKIAILSTGDELASINEELTIGKIYNSNLYMLKSRLLEFGIKDVYAENIGDDPEEIYELIKDLSTSYDLIITTGGVSVGKKDIFHDIVKMKDMKQIFWKLQIQPGTPIMFSMFKNTPVVSLSGNPFASLINFELLVRPLLYNIYKDNSLLMKNKRAILKGDFHKLSRNRRFVRAFYEDGYVTFPDVLHSPGALSSLIVCNCIIDIPLGTPKLNDGDTVQVMII